MPIDSARIIRTIKNGPATGVGNNWPVASQSDGEIVSNSLPASQDAAPNAKDIGLSVPEWKKALSGVTTTTPRTVVRPLRDHPTGRG